MEDGDNSKGKKRPKSPSRAPGTTSTSKKTLKDHEMDLEDDKKHPKHPYEHVKRFIFVKLFLNVF